MTREELLDKLRIAILERQHKYKTTFKGPVAEDVLKDLARFCRAHSSTFDSDPHIAARLDGRREVWNRIQEQLNLSPQEVWRLYQERATS
jgi:hypothetical protein